MIAGLDVARDRQVERHVAVVRRSKRERVQDALQVYLARLIPWYVRRAHGDVLAVSGDTRGYIERRRARDLKQANTANQQYKQQRCRSDHRAGAASLFAIVWLGQRDRHRRRR